MAMADPLETPDAATLRAIITSLETDVTKLRDELVQKCERIEQLIAALDCYGKHEPTCAIMRQQRTTGDEPFPTCTCGLHESY